MFRIQYALLGPPTSIDERFSGASAVLKAPPRQHLLGSPVGGLRRFRSRDAFGPSLVQARPAGCSRGLRGVVPLRLYKRRGKRSRRWSETSEDRMRACGSLCRRGVGYVGLPSSRSSSGYADPNCSRARRTSPSLGWVANQLSAAALAFATSDGVRALPNRVMSS
jgi:hypothetical protein